ncbi:MAG: LamG-like jellyroll fold domain-containing protein, partial [Candidatus Nanopelagicales bacterium]
MKIRKNWLGRSFAAGVAVAISLSGAVLLAPPAMADTAPPAGDPATVSNDALPTAQMDGVAWSQVVIGNTVYVGGKFTKARPPGAAAGTNEVTRSNMLAYDIRTGQLVNSFAPSLNGQVMSLAASPDGSRVYAVGDFSSVNGTNRYRVVALNPSTGAVLSAFAPGLNARGSAIVATNDTVYIGGAFSATGSFNRLHLAAYRASNGAVLNWNPTANGGGANVTALALSPDSSKLVVGGNFTDLNGTTALGLGAVDAATGATVPWQANQTVTDAGTTAAITSLTTSGDRVLGTGYVFGQEAGLPKGTLEGVFSANPDSGQINWVADLHGDHYSAFGANGTTYAVGHAHQGANIGGFPQTDPWTFHRALALTDDARGTNGYQNDGYPSWKGTPSPKPLTWYPDLEAGSYTGQWQAAWNVTGNSDYLVLGGEFPKVNGTAQQGLVRFAKRDLAPNKSGPVLLGSQYVPALSSPATGVVRGALPANYDMDNEDLTYKVYREGKADPIMTKTVNSTFFRRPTVSFIDTSAPAGQTVRYRIFVSDPLGNQVHGDYGSVNVSTSGSASPYAMKVLTDDATAYWRLGEPNGTTAQDWAGNNPGEVGSAVTRGTAGAIIGDTDNASSFPGKNTGTINSSTLASGPNTFSIEGWFKTTSTTGGKIVGFGNVKTGNSASYDRHVYMTNNGKITFGVYPGQVKTVSSAKSYNDGAWHQFVATLSSDGMKLYMDGAQVGQDPSVTSAQGYNGYWRLGGDNLNGWTNRPTNDYFNGGIDDVAVYDSALTPDQVAGHLSLSGRGANVNPTAAFTKTVTDLK